MRNQAWTAAAAFLLAALAGGSVAGQQADAPAGYLAAGSLDLLAVLQPAPRPGSARYAADRRIFRQTRRLEGSDRWRLATADVDTGVRALLRDFGCAAGLELSPETAPRTAALLARVQQDSRAAVDRPKDFYRRRRPFLIDRGPICQPRDPLGRSFDYPSGHATWGWTVALLLAEAVPERRNEILARGRAYGESRVVCGAHNASAIEAGRTSAAALVAALHGEDSFRDDLAASRAELAARRVEARPAAAPSCVAEAALIEPSPF